MAYYLYKPHVQGPNNITTPDIRAGMALLIAALCAQGTSEIHNIHQIDRGYEAIDKRLCALGAHIHREEI